QASASSPSSPTQQQGTADGQPFGNALQSSIQNGLDSQALAGIVADLQIGAVGNAPGSGSAFGRVDTPAGPSLSGSSGINAGAGSSFSQLSTGGFSTAPLSAPVADPSLEASLAAALAGSKPPPGSPSPPASSQPPGPQVLPGPTTSSPGASPAVVNQPTPQPSASPPSP